MTQCFKEQPCDDQRLHHNSTPVADCECQEELLYGSKTLVTDVPILTCACLWRHYQREAQEIVAPNGVLIADPVERNRVINAAYARLWLHDPRFQWAGLAAFASKQVGCGLLHAADSIELIREEHEARQRLRESRRESGLLTPERMSGQADERRDYKEADARNPVPSVDFRSAGEDLSVGQEVLTFGKSYFEILEAFEAIEAGDIALSVERLAWHEQRNILQTTIYEDRHLVALLRGNHVSYVTGFPSGVAQAIELTLTSQCQRVEDGRTIGFGNNPLANLADIDQRMPFVLKAAGRFDQMLNDHSRGALQQSISEIASGGESL